MKMNHLWSVVAAAALCGCVEEHPITYHQPLISPGGEFAMLPPAVQNSVRSQAGMAEIAHIIKKMDSPAGVYEVYFRNADLYPPLFLATDGSVLNPDLTVSVGASRDTIAASTGSVDSGVKMDDLPMSVVVSIRHRAPTAEVDSITRVSSDGQTLYQVTFKDPEHNQPLLLHDDGRLAL